MILALVSERVLLLQQHIMEPFVPRSYYFSDTEWSMESIKGKKVEPVENFWVPSLQLVTRNGEGDGMTRLLRKSNYTIRQLPKHYYLDRWNISFNSIDISKDWTEDVLTAGGMTSFQDELRRNPRYQYVIDALRRQVMHYMKSRDYGCAFRYFFKYLTPDFIAMLDPYLEKFRAASFVVGVHYRWGDRLINSTSVSNILMIQATKFWRYVFAANAHRKNVLYFLATDSILPTLKVLERIPNKTVLRTAGVASHSGKLAMQTPLDKHHTIMTHIHKTMIDFQLLAMTDIIYSTGSTFSGMAAEMGLIPISTLLISRQDY